MSTWECVFMCMFEYVRPDVFCRPTRSRADVGVGHTHVRTYTPLPWTSMVERCGPEVVCYLCRVFDVRTRGHVSRGFCVGVGVSEGLTCKRLGVCRSHREHGRRRRSSTRLQEGHPGRVRGPGVCEST